MSNVADLHKPSGRTESKQDRRISSTTDLLKLSVRIESKQDRKNKQYSRFAKIVCEDRE